ncbi:zinc-binding dehydrogenase [Streptomyces sp. GESEQ-13]|uniref:zinc-binding dehydrogenase n=1 Tax=Streptomyces sp. GESEQ-13 TaxID=2812654 RepID=UPI001B33BBD6
MRAARYHRYGDPTVLTVEEAPDPAPGPGKIRIRVAAASVNPVDWKVRSGAVRDFLPVDLPAIPGRDALADVAPQGIDLVLDTAASGSLGELVEIAGDPSHVVTVADHGNAERLGVRAADAVNDSTYLAEAAALGAQGRYSARVERTYPLEEIAEAHAHSEGGHVRGKTVVAL